MTSVQKHLLACAANYEKRAANPVVAWDRLGAASWAAICEKLAADVAGMSAEIGLKYLKAYRADCTDRAYANMAESPWSSVVSLDMPCELDGLIDPIAGDKCGWIEVASHGGLDDGRLSIRPGYRRMLGVNRCVSFCGRKRGESDDTWLGRRADWLAKYHPGIFVTCTEPGWGWGLGGGQCTSLIGSVGEFAKVAHLRMDKESCCKCHLPVAGRRTERHVASYATECGPMCGMCHKELVPAQHRKENALDPTQPVT